MENVRRRQGGQDENLKLRGDMTDKVRILRGGRRDMMRS